MSSDSVKGQGPEDTKMIFKIKISEKGIRVMA